MSFLAPAAFFLAGLMPIIIAMYLLKLRRTDRVVSSVYLWQELLRDVEANAPWQRLRRNLLMILQLLFLVLMTLVLARPFTWVEGASGKEMILILDTSASMAAEDVEPNRLEAAKTQARQFVDDMPDDGRATVISSGTEAEVLVSSTQDRRKIHQAIDGAQIAIGESDLSDALQLAAAIAARQPDTEIIILSDGRVTLPERMSLQALVRYYPIGISGDNQAISSLTLQSAGSGNRMTAFAQVANYSDKAASRRLELYADGVLVMAYSMELEPEEDEVFLFEDVPAGTEVLEGFLAGEDNFAIDDHAWAVASAGEPVNIHLVSDGNLFLETALRLLPDVTIATIATSDFDLIQENESAAEVVVFDRFVPTSIPENESALFFIAPPSSTELFNVAGRVEQPVPDIAAPEDVILEHVSFASVNLLDTVSINLPGWASLLVRGEAGDQSVPLLFSGVIGGRRVAVMSFDLHHSDLPLQVTFPVLVANLVNWLTPQFAAGSTSQVKAGQPISVRLPLDQETATVILPNGDRQRLAAGEGNSVFVATTQLGVYEVLMGDERRFIAAVNLFSGQESDIQPADTLAVQGLGLEAGGQLRQEARREWWRPLAFLALAVLMVEWFVYHRATLYRLWAGLRGESEAIS